MDFKKLLLEAGITKAELARRLGVSPDCVSAWKDKPQKYAVTYLELLVKYNRVHSILESGK